MNKPITVSELNGLVNSVLTSGYDFQKVLIEGEISGFKVSQNKWIYFDIKDGQATIGCFMTVWQLKIPLEDGMKVIISGNPKLLEWGKFSYTVEHIEPFGEGALKRAYELLKQKLETEGLFASDRKREIPRFPSNIGLITAPESAAYHDFVNTVDKRWSGVKINFAPVLVQGRDAVSQITNAIDWFSKHKPQLDALVIIRGGGSLEDLQAFNSEDVARAIFRSKIPVICGVGHDVDISLADLVADMRAKTPTDAAVQLVPDRKAIRDEINYLGSRIAENYERRLRQDQLFLDQAISYLIHFADNQQKRFWEAIAGLQKDFVYFARSFSERKRQLLNLNKSIMSRFRFFTDELSNKIEFELRTLKNLDPKHVLARGYSIVFKGDKVVKSKDQIKKKDKLVLKLFDGELKTEVTE